MMTELEQHEQAEYQASSRVIAPRILTSSVNDPRTGNSRLRKIWLMEGGYCSDTKFEENLAEKTVHHERLIEILKSYSYP